MNEFYGNGLGYLVGPIREDALVSTSKLELVARACSEYDTESGGTAAGDAFRAMLGELLDYRRRPKQSPARD